MRLGKKELATVRRALAYYLDESGLMRGDAAYVTKLLAKVDEQSDRKAAPLRAAGAVGVNAGPIHDALVEAAGGKVASMKDAGPAWWARASRSLAKVNATPEKARLLGIWVANQTWMTGAMGWDTLLHKWEDWSARAATEFGNHSTSEGSVQGQGTQAGRRKESW